jgi:peptide/nickel transport system permease protein
MNATMLFYIFRRMIYAVPIALCVTVIVFSLVQIAPGDPISAIMPDDASAEMVAKARHDYGLDKPIPIQYLLWLRRAAQGDLGISIATGRPVAQELAAAVGNTVILAVSAGLVSCIAGFLLGMAAGLSRGGLLDRFVSFLTVWGVSIPHYWLAILLVIVFSVNLGWLPPMGLGPDSVVGWHLDLAHLRYLIMPTIATAATPTAIIARTMRASVADIFQQDFVTSLQAKGLFSARVLWHVVVNAFPTTLTVMGLQLGTMLGGSVLVETIFAWPGTGFLLGSAVFKRDLPMLQGALLVLALFFVALNLIVDLLQGLIDPRIKRAG